MAQKYGKASRKWLRACEGVIMDALKDATPFIRECLRQCCSALGWQGGSARWPCCPLEPAGQAGQEPRCCQSCSASSPASCDLFTALGHGSEPLGTELLCPQAITGARGGVGGEEVSYPLRRGTEWFGVVGMVKIISFQPHCHRQGRSPANLAWKGF